MGYGLMQTYGLWYENSCPPSQWIAQGMSYEGLWVNRCMDYKGFNCNEVLAFIFQGPARPTDDDIKCTPMLVRRNNVKDALEWLKLNHVDYEDLYISEETLNTYPLAGIPVEIQYS